MSARALRQQFVRDLKASWPRTALLGVLLLVGMWFWIPPLFRAVTGSSGSSSGKPAGIPKASTGQSALTDSTRTSSPAQSQFAEYSWEQIEQISQTDPLVRSAEVAALETSPFHIDRDQFSPPVLFAGEPKMEKPIQDPEPVVQEPAGIERLTPADLVLKSTIVGVRRRAAYINRKLYFVGAEIQSGGNTWLLKSVEPRRVILQRGDEEFELRIGSNTEVDQGPL